MPRLDVRSKEQIKSVLYLFSLFIITASTVKALVNPVPLIDSVSPVSAAPGASGLTLTVHGAGFLANSTVNWNVGATTTALVTTFVSSTQLQAAVPNSLVTSSLSASITVVNPSVGAASNVIYFPVLAAIPSVSFTGTNLPAGNGAYSLAVGDFNRDGLPDFAVANNLDSTVSLFLSQTGSPGTFSASTIGTAEGSFSGPTGIIAADFNNDGYIDFAVANGNSNSVSVLLNTPATPGTFTLAQSTTFAAGSFPAAIAAADFNGDGYTDLVVSNYNGHDVTVLFNSTGGTPANFSAAPGSPYSVPSNPNGIAVADFNNDGYPDFAVTVNTSPGQIAVFLNNNGGTVGSFASTTAITVGSDPVGLIAADFDQDGKIDLAVANYLSNSVWVLPGNGSGSFSASGPQLSVNGNPYGLATGDLNADGKLDIAVTDSLNGKVDVFLASAGTPGTFSATPLVFNADTGTQGLGIADFDSDGSLDIAAASYYGATATTLIQLATATLLPSTINFGIQLLNTPSTAQTTVLTNTGSLPLTISSIAVSGANSSDFSLTSNPTNNCGGSVAAGASCTISVTFTPAGADPRSATLNLVDNLPSSPQTVSLSGTGGVPTVGISPNILNFNTQPVDTTSAAQSVTLSNTGAVALTITSIAVIGDFAETNNCGSSVPTSGSCVISLTFTPAASGTRNGTLTVTDNSGGVSGTTQTASLSGTGIAPIASLAPSTLSFGNQLVGSTSTAQSLTLSNRV